MSTRKSLALSFLDRYAGLALAIASSMVIARLLTPAEVGVYSVVLVLLSLMSTVRDFGAGQYLLQAKVLTTDGIRSVWAIQLGVGVLLAVLTFIASAPVSQFYNDSRMEKIMWLLSFNYLINPVGSVTYAWLMREMKFGALAWMRFLSASAGALVSVGLAWQGYGPISLAWGSLAGTCVNALVASYHRPPNYPWLPGTKEIRQAFSFGSRLTGASIINNLANGSAEFFLAKLQGLTAVGLYSRANGLVAMFRSLIGDAVNAVALPMFAKAARESGNAPHVFVKVQSYVSAVGWPFCGMVCLLAHPMIRVLYGSQWDGAVDLTRLLAVAMMLQVPLGTCQTMLISTGAATRFLKATLLASLVSIGCIVIGTHADLLWLGAALIVAAAINLTTWLVICQRQLRFSWHALGVAAARSAGVTMVAITGPSLVLWSEGLRPTHSLLPLIAGLISCGIGFVIGCFVVNHPIKEELLRLWARVQGICHQFLARRRRS